MEKCKFCQSELAENGTFCPNCGKDNSVEGQPLYSITKIGEKQNSSGDWHVSFKDFEHRDPLEEFISSKEEKDVSVSESAVESAEQAAQEETAAEETSAEIKEGIKATPAKIALAIAAVVVLLAVLVALITMGGKNGKTEVVAETAAVEETVVATVPADGNPDDVTCKGTYTVDDETALAEKDTVVATMGEHVLTNSQLRIYYRSAISSFLNTEYGYYMMMYGMLDYTQPLDTQMSSEGDMTWQQFFVQYSLDNWRLTQALALKAEENGVEMNPEDQEYLATMQTTLEQLAANNGLSVEDMLAADFGIGMTYEDFEEYQALYLQGSPYYDAEVAKLVPTEEEVEAYFDANEESFASSGITKDSKYVDVRHILVQVKGGFADVNGNMTHTDEEWATCEAEAQAILDAWLAGDKTEDSFAALANEKSEDPGSNTTGGLYEDVYMGQMVEPFETWCFDENRQYGDYGLVQTSYGYHVMFFVGSQPMWQEYARSAWVNEQTDLLLDAIVEDYPMEVTYENIALADVKLG